MAGFKAAEAVEPLEYDFEPYVPGVKGVIPEPSTAQLEEYFDKARAMASELIGLRDKMTSMAGDDAADLTEEQVVALTTDLESVDIKDIQHKMVGLVADLCSQQPSTEQIEALPFRVRQSFIEWVGAQFRQKR